MFNFYDLFTKKSIPYKGRTFNVFDFVSNNINYNSFDLMCEQIRSQIKDDTIIFVDDERIESFGYECIDNFFKVLKQIDTNKKNLLFIFVTNKFFNCAKEYSLNNFIYEPHLEVLNTYYFLKKYKKYLVGDYEKSVPFVCLNGLINPIRLQLIHELDSFNILESGYVTAFTQSFSDLPKNIRQKLKYDKVFESFYYKNQYSATKNLINLLYIDKHIPGNIFLTVESFNSTDVEKSLRPLYTEKTLSPFLLKRIPIIIGFKNIMRTLKNEGFDIFDDIINYNYDEIDPVNYTEKIKTCLEYNRNILIEPFNYQKYNLDERLEYNKNHIFDWLKIKVNNIELNVKTNLDSFLK